MNGRNNNIGEKRKFRRCKECNENIPISPYDEWYCKKCDVPFSVGYCSRCEENIEISSFADQHCHGCEKAGSLFEHRKQKILKGERRSLSKEEQERVEASMPEGMEHLNSCVASGVCVHN